MVRHMEISRRELHRQIKEGTLRLAGNSRLKIYGTLRCASGKRMKKENRVFFTNEPEALAEGYRPCGHCMKKAYEHWKHGII